MLIDFETFCEIDASNGAARYAQDASFRVLCMAYSGGVWQPGEPFPAVLLAHVQAGRPIYAWNTAFEIAVWHRCTQLYGFPVMPLRQWRDTQAACLAAGGPARLDYAGDMLDLPAKKDKAGHRLMLRYCKPNKHGGRPVPTGEDLAGLLSYAAQDVATEQAAKDALPELPTSEQQIWELSERINARGLYVDTQFAREAQDLWATYHRQQASRFAQLTGGLRATQTKALTAWLGVKSLAKGKLQSLLEDKKICDKTREVIQLRLELASSATAKYDKMIACAGADSRIRGCFRYHKGHTGRWGGALIQPQNLPRGVVPLDEVPAAIRLVKSRDIDALKARWGDLGDVLGSLVRSTIRAAPGNTLSVADFAGIEARVVAWLAGEEHMLQAFRDGDDVYRVMASKVFGVPPERVTKDQRFIGKTLVLGCSYQMGGPKFAATLKDQWNTDIAVDIAASYVDAYRRANHHIVCLWYDLQADFHNTVGTRKPHGRFRWYRDRWVAMRLPSGRDMLYYEPRLEQGKYGLEIRYTGVDNQSGRPVEQKTYGGKLAENLTQAVARDVLVVALRKCEAYGLPVVGHVHDEIIVEDKAPRLRELLAVMQQPVPWATDLPVKAEGWTGEFFRK